MCSSQGQQPSHIVPPLEIDHGSPPPRHQPRVEPHLCEQPDQILAKGLVRADDLQMRLALGRIGRPGPDETPAQKGIPATTLLHQPPGDTRLEYEVVAKDAHLI